MVAELGKKRWEVFDWSETVEVTDECSFNVKEILDEFKELPINKHHEYFGSKISVKLQEAP